MTDEAINRYKRNAEARDNAQKKRSRANFKSIVVGLLVVVAIVYWFAYKDSVDWENLSIQSLVASLREGVSSSKGDAERAEREFRDHYAAIASEFAKGELSQWKNAPRELKPKYAPPGTVYYALVPRELGFDLYQLKGGGEVDEITPFGRPVPTTFDAFRKVCNGKPYFIATSGRTFVGGGGDPAAMDQLRKALLP